MHTLKPLNYDAHLIKRFGKEVRRFSLGIDHDNKWQTTLHAVASVKMPPTKVPLLGYGKVFLIDNDVLPNAHHYHVTIGDFPSCNYLDFVKMFMAALSKRGKWVPCKHLYYIFYHVMHCNPKLDVCIHQPTLSFDEVSCLLAQAFVNHP